MHASKCVICERDYEAEDMAHCPAYQGRFVPCVARSMPVMIYKPTGISPRNGTGFAACAPAPTAYLGKPGWGIIGY